MNRIVFKDEWEEREMSVGRDRLSSGRRRRGRTRRIRRGTVRPPHVGEDRGTHKGKEKTEWIPVQKIERTTSEGEVGFKPHYRRKKETETTYEPESR